MKFLSTTLFIVLFVAFAHAQDSVILSDVKILNSTPGLYQFRIPAALNGSNFDPNPVSNLNYNLTDSKISLKVGMPAIFRPVDKLKSISGLTGFFQVNFKASNGVTTLFKDKSPSVEYGLTGGISKIVQHTYWVSRSNTNKRTTEEVKWLGVTGGFDRSNLNLLYPDALYGYLKDPYHATTKSAFLTFNNYYFSTYNPWWNKILSVGLGYAETNNYYALKKRTYEKGKLVTDGTNSYETVTETASGALGPLTTYRGLAFYLEYYYPVVRKDDGFGSIHFGGRLTHYAVFKSEKLINGSAGFYFALKNAKEEDAANFAITGQFDQLNKRKESDYFSNNFSVLLQASVPLRFN